ncbi:helix-turn-helix domain-containing protein [Paraburkholderia sediminicola]|uniref:helix-turn-helix domain-containing protein n=1 Tax=Paraburkholderia sediminicola TaxID=458836 RepID=UPI0038BB1EE0
MTGGREWIPRSDARRIAQRLRERRRALGLTQAELATMAAVAQSTLVHWERGRWPDTVATATVKTLEAALQVPQGWLLSRDMEPLPDPGFNAGGAAAREGGGDLQTRIPQARCREIGPHARRLREELGLSVAEVARACAVSNPTLLQWEQGTFPKALTAARLRAWERALLLAPDQLLAPPAAHPGLRDGRWRVVVEAETLETAIRRVAECLATRGRNLVRPEQPLDAKAVRNADLLAHRYGIGTRRWPLIDIAVACGITLSHAHQTIAGMIVRAAQFEFDIVVLDASAAGLRSTTAVADRRMRDFLGPSLSMERAEAFTGEILSRRIASADTSMAMTCTSIPK